jgi:hypothetical protein
LPDFIIVGTQRGGTTSLYNYLGEHPNVAQARVKEAHYFSFQFDRGLAWYKGLFPRTRGLARRICGEASPYYLFHPDVPERVRDVCPDVKLIVLLREPVARAYSHFRLERKKGEEPLAFADAVEREAERLEAEPSFEGHAHRHHSYLARGRYAEQLERWVGHFGREQFLILKSEDLFEHPHVVYQQTLDFLGVPAHELERFERYNASDGLETLPSALRGELMTSFRPHNEHLYELIGRDMGWES